MTADCNQPDTHDSWMIVMFGAEFTQVWTRRYGPRVVPEDGAVIAAP